MQWQGQPEKGSSDLQPPLGAGGRFTYGLFESGPPMPDGGPGGAIAVIMHAQTNQQKAEANSLGYHARSLMSDARCQVAAAFNLLLLKYTISGSPSPRFSMHPER